MPKGRCIDVVNNDFRKVSFRNWRTEGKDRQTWMVENPRRGQHPQRAVVQMIMTQEARDVTIHR